MSPRLRRPQRPRSDAHLSDFELSERLDGRLPSGVALQHVSACAQCQTDLAALSVIRAEARLLQAQVVEGADAWHEVAARTLYRHQLRRMVRRQLRWPLVAALTVGMLLGVFFSNGLRMLVSRAFGLQLQVGLGQLESLETLRRITPEATAPSASQPPAPPR